VRVSVTHNHANPIMWDNWIGGRPEDVQAYRASLPGAAAGAARAAKLALRPVRTAAGVGAAHIGRNRRQRVPDPTDPGRTRMIVGRDDAGTVDPAVTVVRFDELDGRPYAALLGYTCHPTTLGPDNRLHSPDYPGVAKAVVEASTGAPCLFLQGAAGNVGPMEGFTGDVAVVERLGTILGLEGAKVFVGLETRPVELRYVRPRESGATLAVWEEHPVAEAARPPDGPPRRRRAPPQAAAAPGRGRDRVRALARRARPGHLGRLAAPSGSRRRCGAPAAPRWR
jgi:hypothetical protein